MLVDVVATLLRYLAAYEAKDLAAIRAMLSPEVRLQDWNISVRGIEAVLSETKKNFEDANLLSIEVLQIFSNQHSAAAQLHIVVNQTVHLEVVDVLTINAEGQVTSIRAFKG